MRVLAATLAVVLLAEELMLLVYGPSLRHLVTRPISPWAPLGVMGPFIAYQGVVMAVLRHRRRLRRPVPTVARFVNAAVETSLPSVILWTISHYLSPPLAFGTWPSMLYFVFIVASTLRLDFVLPAFTGAASAAGYLTVAGLGLDLSGTSADPLLTPVLHVTRAAIMLVAGVVAGLVARRLRRTFRRAVEEGAARERVTNLFGQHVSPAVVDRLLERPAELAGELREICVMFLDIRNFTAQARQRRPPEVVEFLNGVFAFMIEAVDRHGGFVNKFLGDGFMAVFGAPLDDAEAAHHAVAAARDILGEIEARRLAEGPWPLRVGMGLHLGPAVVGTVGSPRRKEFTAIGDTVNMAARLEQLNKEVGSQLLVSDAMAVALGQRREPAALVGDVAVRGYEGPVRVWRLA